MRTAGSPTPPAPSLWRTQISWVTWALIASSVPVTVFALFQAAHDAEGDTLWGIVMFVTPAVVTAYAVLEVLWTRSELLASSFFRMLAIPGVAAAVATLTIAVTYALPAVQDILARTREADGWHYWLEGDVGNPWLMSLVAGYGAGVLAGLLVWVVVVLPVTAIRRPRVFAEANMMSTDEKDFERNRRAGIAMAFLLILVFAIPSLIIFGAESAAADDVVELFADFGWTLRAPLDSLGELAWMLGLLLIPVGVWLLWYVYITQRVDRERRGAAGVPTGLRRPGDDD